MTKKQPNNLKHFFLPEDQHLFDYDQIFSVSAMWVELGMTEVEATYDLYVRGMPKNRNFLLFGGLEEIIEGIKEWKYTKDEIDFLLKNKVITAKMARQLRNFKYQGDIWAMPEGTVFFPEEPVVRLTGPIWQINLLTFFLINALTANTIPFSKIVRSFLAGGDKIKVVTCPVTRAHSNETSLKFGRAAYLLGADSSIVPAFARKYNLPVSHVNTKAYHAFIKSFPSELEAMRAATSVFPHIGLMVDTYDFQQGVQNAITVAQELKTKGKQTIASIVIDSGKDAADFVRQARQVRQSLDRAKLKSVKITVAGNFEEQKIAKLVKMQAPIDAVIACTDLVTSSDDPKLEAVLKIAEFKRDGQTFNSAKLTPGKESYPGQKQVFRVYRRRIMAKDIIGLQGEKLGKPLLKKMISQSKVVAKLPSLDQIRTYTSQQLQTLPQNLRGVSKQVKYKVEISSNLKKLFQETKQQHLNREK